jgi:hypothetical protein
MTLKCEILNLFNILAVPAEVFKDIDATPRWRMPAALLFFISPLIGFIIIPAAIEPLRKIYEEAFDTRTAEIALQTSTHYLTIINVIFEPLIKMSRWVILSAVIFSFISLYDRKRLLPYRKVFTFVAYGEIIFHLMGIISALIINIRGVHNISHPSELVVFKGINYFLYKNSVPAYVYNSLEYINPFSVWYICVLSRGVNILAGMRYVTSFVLVSAAWFTWILAASGELFLMKKVLDIFY